MKKLLTALSAMVLATTVYAGEVQTLEPQDQDIEAVRVGVVCNTGENLMDLLDNWASRRAAGSPGEGCYPVTGGATVPFEPQFRYLDDEGDTTVIGTTKTSTGVMFFVFTMAPEPVGEAL